MVLVSSIWKQIAPWVFEDLNRKKKIQPIPWATYVDESQAMFGSGVAPTAVPTQQTTTDTLYQWLPQPVKKVATTTNPVITRSAPAPTSMTPPATDFDNMTDSQLKDMIARGQLNPSKLTQEEQFKLTRAWQVLQDRAFQQTNVKPLQEQITTKQQELAAKEKELADRDARLKEAKLKELETLYWVKRSREQEAGQKTMSAAQWVLSFSWFGRSTYAAEKQAEIQQTVNDNLSLLDQQKELAIQEYEASLRWATSEELAWYRTAITNLETKSAEIAWTLMQEMNKYNIENAKNMQEKIDNIINMAWAFSTTPLPPEMDAYVSEIASGVIDNEWNIDNTLLEWMDTKTKWAVIRKAAEIKKSMPKAFEAPDTVKGDDGSIYAWNEETGEFEKVITGSWPKSEWKSDGIGWFWRTNPVTWAPEEWNGQSMPSGWWGWGWGGWPTPQGKSNTTDLIKKREGFRENAYLDPVWIPTIWYGFTSVNWKPVQLWQTMSREQADVMLQDKIQEYSNWRNFVNADLSPSQEAALTSFEFNLWKGIWEKNAMGILEDVNKWNLQSAAKKMQQYVNAWGKMLPWLANRRREEAQLLMTPKEFDLMSEAPAQWKQYSQSQKNLMSWMKDKSLGATELKLLKQQWLTANDVYDYNASQKWLELSDDQRTMYNTQLTAFRSNPVVKSFEEGIQNYDNIAASLDDTSWVGDMAWVFQFMKSLDPQSVVREQEFNTAAGSAGVVNKLWNTFAKLSEWKILTEEQAKAFKKLAKKYIENRAKSYDRLYWDMERALTNSKIDKSYFPTKASSTLKQSNTSTANITPQKSKQANDLWNSL